MKIKLAAIAKDEGAYIPAWVFHHFQTGFDEIEIWLNGITDNSYCICKKLRDKYPDSFRYIDGDELLNECKTKGLNFQIEAYKLIYRDAKEENFTHILFLDLDEFWISRNFEYNIKDLVIKLDYADAISFQWYFDTPRHDNSEFDLWTSNKFAAKNEHVKTLLRITDRVEKIHIHNHLIFEGNYVMSDGSSFVEEGAIRQHNKSRISMNIFEKQKFHLDDFYILHTVYRSPKEYVASLLRGNNNPKYTDLFKMNRWGYVPFDTNVPNLEISSFKEIYKNYHDMYDKFLNNNSLFQDVLVAREFLLKRFDSVIGHLNNDPGLLNRYKRLFRGIDLSDYLSGDFNGYGISFNVDSVNRIDTSEVLIQGWVFDKNTNKPPEINAKLSNGNKLKCRIQSVERPDVVAVHDKAHLKCGFKLFLDFYSLKEGSSNKSDLILSFKNKFGSLDHDIILAKLDFLN
jgi:hypothetical protein